MKLKINRDRLADIVARGTSSAPKNSTIPILNNARIVAAKGLVHIASMDPDKLVEATGECDVEQAGSVTVDAAKLKMTVDRMPKGVDVSLVLDDKKNELVLKAGRSRVTFPTLPVSDWPARDQTVNGASFVLPGADIVKLFSHTSKALSEIVGNPMSGVFLHRREVDGRERLAAVGTTGHILIMSTAPAPEGSEDMPSKDGQAPGVIVSDDTVAAMLNLFKAADDVNVEVDERSILLHTNETRLCSSLIGSTYPNYSPLVENPAAVRALVSRDRCISAVSLFETFLTREGGHRVQCAGSDDGLVIAVGSQTGNGVDVVEAEIEGEVKAFGLNGQFMKTVLGAFKSASVAVHPDHANKRVLFQAENEPDLVGVVAMMNIPTTLATGPKHE
jgi:DNA polymerase III subunit beta